MALRESEGCIVPLKLDDQSSGSKPGNAGAGKASKPTRGPAGAPPNTESDEGSFPKGFAACLGMSVLVGSRMR